MEKDLRFDVLDRLGDADMILTGMQEMILKAFDPDKLPEDPEKRNWIADYGGIIRRQAKMVLEIIKGAEDALLTK